MSASSIVAPPRSPAEPGVERVTDPRLGEGACSVPGCPCQDYNKAVGSDLCSNCGHHYNQHW